jgi:hypothetical protein
MKYTLLVSYSCGISYDKEMEADTIEELKPRMDECDRLYLRYAIEENSELSIKNVCAIHRNIIATLAATDSKGKS